MDFEKKFGIGLLTLLLATGIGGIYLSQHIKEQEHAERAICLQEEQVRFIHNLEQKHLARIVGGMGLYLDGERIEDSIRNAYREDPGYAASFLEYLMAKADSAEKARTAVLRRYDSLLEHDPQVIQLSR